MRRIVRLDLALLILLWSVGYSLFIFADSLRRPLIPHRESASGLVQEYGVFQSREDFSDSLGGCRWLQLARLGVVADCYVEQ